MNIVIPCAGAGSRFEKAGYTFPKPLIEVNGKPMIQAVVENLGAFNPDSKFIFIVQKAHYEKYALKYLLSLIAPNCEIVQVDGLTEGAACTTLLAKEFIDNDEQLLIANSDQIIDWKQLVSDDLQTGEREALHTQTPGYFFNLAPDGLIYTFHGTHPKWSFARCNQYFEVLEVAEKKPISTDATCGVYMWKKGSDYVKYAEQMISKNIRTNNEFYVAPVFNEAIQDGKKILKWEVRKMWGIGTPEDLNTYLEAHK